MKFEKENRLSMLLNKSSDVSVEINKKLNQISKDIKSVEKSFKSYVKTIFYFDTPENGRLYFNGDRLLYIDSNTSKPLIEMPLEIRVKMYEYLPDLVESGLACLDKHNDEVSKIVINYNKTVG